MVNPRLSKSEDLTNIEVESELGHSCCIITVSLIQFTFVFRIPMPGLECIKESLPVGFSQYEIGSGKRRKT